MYTNTDIYYAKPKLIFNLLYRFVCNIRVVNTLLKGIKHIRKTFCDIREIHIQTQQRTMLSFPVLRAYHCACNGQQVPSCYSTQTQLIHLKNDGN